MYTEKPTTSVKGNHGSVSLFKVAAEGAKSGFARLTMDENTGVFIDTPEGKLNIHVGYKGQGVDITIWGEPKVELTHWGSETEVTLKDYDAAKEEPKVEPEPVATPIVIDRYGKELNVGDRVGVSAEAVEHSLRFKTGTIVAFHTDKDSTWPCIFFPQVDGLHNGRGMADRDVDDDEYDGHLWYVNPASLSRKLRLVKVESK